MSTDGQQTLEPFVDEIVGIDVSDEMVKHYQKRATGSMRATRGDVMVAEASISGPEFFNFDVIVMSMALHHVDNPELCIQQLVKRLVPGGTLVIIDWDPNGCTLSPWKLGHAGHGEAGHGHGHGHAGQHHSGQGNGGHNHPGNKEAGHDIHHNLNTNPATLGVAFDGFGKAEIEKWLKGAGCQEAEWVEFAEKVSSGQLFMAKGRKAI